MCFIIVKYLPFEKNLLFKDEHIIMLNKPHFIPVIPIRRCVRESLLSRFKHRFQNEEISPINRLDRETAGVMLYSCNANISRAYQYLFEKRLVKKAMKRLRLYLPLIENFLIHIATTLWRAMIHFLLCMKMKSLSLIPKL